jgi:hypothetical protein
MYCLKEPLQSFEALFALDSEQAIFLSLSRPMPAASDQSGIVGDIFLVDKPKARLLHEVLVDSARHEEKKTNGAPER